jgi:hypothetical protein
MGKSLQQITDPLNSIDGCFMELNFPDISAPGVDPHKTLEMFLDRLCNDMRLEAPQGSRSPDFGAIITQGKGSGGKGNWFDEFKEGRFSLNSTEGLAFCRLVARMAAASEKQPNEGWGTTYYFASAWVRHLISPEGTSQRFFLQEYVARDEGLYDAGTLRPKPWVGKNGWRKAYPWLRHPENLTITEMELVLAIFRPQTNQGSGLARWARACGLSHSRLLWTCFPAKMQGGPRFVGWIERYPHLLWQIHRFLLSRYCFQLLPAFREALRAGQRQNGSASAKKSHLYAPPFRAGEFLTLYPRIAGLVAIGFLGLMEVDLAQVLFFATNWRVALAAGVVSLVILFLLNYMDVYKQNRGVMSDRRHGVGRALSLLARFWGWSALMGGVYTFLVYLMCQDTVNHEVAIQTWPSWPTPDQPPLNGLWNLLIPTFPPLVDDGRFPLGLFAMISASCLLGALLQWFFEDTAATEPI